MYDKNLSLRPLDNENRQLLRLPIFSPKQPVPMLYQTSYKNRLKLKTFEKKSAWVQVQLLRPFCH